MAPQFILSISTSSGVAKVACVTKPVLNALAPPIAFSFEIVDYKSQSALLLPTIGQHLNAIDQHIHVSYEIACGLAYF